MKVLVIGANGFLGQKILKYSKIYAPDDIFFGADIDISLIPDEFKKYRLDITRKDQINNMISDLNPDLTILTAAMTNVDACEEFQEKTYAINALGPKNIATAVLDIGGKMIHVSTDFVFDGEKGNYVESDHPDPINYYGVSKLAGENFIVKSGVSYLICRTSVLYGWPFKNQRDNFFSWVYKKLQNGEHLKIISTQINSPTLCDDLASCILKIRHFKENKILHTCGSERISRYDFVLKIAHIFDFNLELIEKTLKFQQKATRPSDSSMINDKVENKFGVKFKNVQDALVFLSDQKVGCLK